MIDGEPWFVAADVCALLDVKNVTQAVGRLDGDERTMFNIGRQGDSSIVSEPGLYSLILGSRKPEATKFKRWVTHDVLPSHCCKISSYPRLRRKRWRPFYPLFLHP